jgi:hypothetical protein
MLILGLLLIVLAVGATLVAVLGAPTARVEFELGGLSLSMGPLWVFFAGAATVLLLVLGLELIRAGARRARRRRRDKKELHRLSEQARRDRGSGTAGTRDPRADTRGRDTSGTAVDDDVTGPDHPAR